MRIAHVLKHHILSSTTPELIVTLFGMLEVYPKQRFSACKALMYLRKHNELGYFLSLGTDPGEQPIPEEDDGVQW